MYICRRMTKEHRDYDKATGHWENSGRGLGEKEGDDVTDAGHYRVNAAKV